MLPTGGIDRQVPLGGEETSATQVPDSLPQHTRAGMAAHGLSCGLECQDQGVLRVGAPRGLCPDVQEGVLLLSPLFSTLFQSWAGSQGLEHTGH